MCRCACDFLNTNWRRCFELMPNIYLMAWRNAWGCSYLLKKCSLKQKLFFGQIAKMPWTFFWTMRWRKHTHIFQHVFSCFLFFFFLFSFSLSLSNRYAHSAGPIVDTVFDAIFLWKIEFSWKRHFMHFWAVGVPGNCRGRNWESNAWVGVGKWHCRFLFPYE